MLALVVNVYNVKIEHRHGRLGRIRPTYARRIWHAIAVVGGMGFVPSSKTG